MKTKIKISAIMSVVLAICLLMALVPAINGNNLVAEAQTAITSPLNFTEGSADIATYATMKNGVKWDNASKTLTLSSAVIDCSAVTDCEYAINLPVSSKICLENKTTSVIKSGNGRDKSMGILVGTYAKPGDLEVLGLGGTLEIYSADVAASDVGTLTTAFHASMVNVGDGSDYPIIKAVAGTHQYRSYGANSPVTVKSGELYLTGSVGACNNFMLTPNKTNATTKAVVTISSTYKEEVANLEDGVFSGINTKTVKVVKGSMPGTIIPVTSITGVPTTGKARVDLRLSAVVKPYEATHKDIIWSVVNAGTTGAQYKNGVLSTTNAGVVVIRATIKMGVSETQDYTQDFAISISSPFVAVSSINDVPGHLIIGTPLNLTGKVYPNNATNKDITWSLVNDGGTGAVLEGNVLTATAEGTIRVMATIEGGKTESTAFTKVFDIVSTPQFVAVTNIADLPDFVEVNKGFTLTGKVEPENATHKDIVWSIVENNAGATLNGNVLTTTEIGSVTMRATIVDGTEDGDYTQDFVLNSNTVGVSVESVRLDKNILEMRMDTTETLIATITPSNASNPALVWSSSNDSIATVDENGVITPHRVGKVVITVKSVESGKYDTCEVTVLKAQLTTERIILIVCVVVIAGVAIATAIACVIIRARRNKYYVLKDDSEG